MPDTCLRCDYNLTGIANAQPCPECGLLAERSRRVTDELHQSRPRWLRRLSLGVWLVLASVAALVAAFLTQELLVRWAAQRYWRYGLASYYAMMAHARLLPFDLVLLLLTAGVCLLASREGYDEADRADARRRRNLRLALLGPWLPLVVAHVAIASQSLANSTGYAGYTSDVELATVAAGSLGSVPLAVLMARRLRDLAARARSAHLAEHCLIVGYGTAATLVYIPCAGALLNYADRIGLGANFASRGNASLLLVLLMSTAGFLFILWQLYLLVRFALAFGSAARALRRQWRRDDRADSPA